MYQVEDVIRAYQFDLDALLNDYVSRHLPNESFLPAYRQWYADLIEQMKSQGIQKSGHILDLQEIMVELSYLHNTMLNVSGDHKYKEVFERALPFVEEFKERSNLKDKNHLEVAFNALYMKLLLRLKGTEISAESEEGFDAMRIMLAYLSRCYRQMKDGNLDFLQN